MYRYNTYSKNIVGRTDIEINSYFLFNGLYLNKNFTERISVITFKFAERRRQTSYTYVFSYKKNFLYTS